MAIDIVANDRARVRLVAYLREGRAIALTGAGLSMWAGYPSWPELLQRLVAYIIDHGDGAPGVAARANEILRVRASPLHIARQLGGMLAQPDFADFINLQLGPKDRRLHEMVDVVASLPFRHFLTLNLDPTLSDALLLRQEQPFATFTCYQTGRLVRFMKSLGHGVNQYSRQLVHLHGRYDDPLDHIVLTKDGYDKLYGTELLKTFFQILAMTQRIVFLGFGFQDDNFLAAFKGAARSIETPELCHFAIVPLANAEEDITRRNRFRDEWNVEPVFYEKVDVDDGHGGYGSFRVEVVRLAENLLPLAQPAAAPAAPAAPEVAAASVDPGDTAIAEQLSEATLDQIGGDDDV